MIRVKIEYSDRKLKISFIESNSDDVYSDEVFAERLVNYLILSHALNLLVPHPVHPDIPDDPEQIARDSFTRFGQWGVFASYENTIDISDDEINKALKYNMKYCC